MGPQIQYVRSTDGASIAYTDAGSGRPLVFAIPTPTSIELDHELPITRDFYLDLERRIIRYDMRGWGASQREADLSLERQVDDIASLVGHLGLAEFDLFGGPYGSSAIAYAARWPSRVARLVLWEPSPVGPSKMSRQEREAERLLIASRWMGATRVMGDGLVPRASMEVKKWITRVYRHCATPDSYLRLTDIVVDPMPDLPRITCPTLIVHARNDSQIPLQTSHEAAAAVPGATLNVIDGDTAFFFLYGDQLVPILKRFLGDNGESGLVLTATSAVGISATAIILFADIVDSTALTERMGDSAFREKARALDDALRSAVRDRGGTVIDAKTLGDGILATFPSASQAIAAALACSAAGQTHALPLHHGLHAGDVLRESDNVFGGAVNIAARISALSAPGEVLVSRTVADLARTSAGVTFEDRGEHALKGIAEPQRIYAVHPNA